VPELPPIEPDLVAELTALAATVATRADHADVAARLEWLIDTLILRGQLPASFAALARKIKGTGDRSVVKLSVVRDKYGVASPDIDCAALIPLCKARCCSFEVALSSQDLEERVLPFTIADPYMLPRDHGRCVCMDAAGACTVYSHRPATCRSYDCRRDRRVWVDFEARIPAG
jgi:Fe-S-cluster containining protein